MFAPPLEKTNPPVSSISFFKKTFNPNGSNVVLLTTLRPLNYRPLIEGKENLNQCFLIRCCFPQTSFLFNLEKQDNWGPSFDSLFSSRVTSTIQVAH